MGENSRPLSLSDAIFFGKHFSNPRNRNLNCLLFAHININSVRNKFDQLVDGIKNNIDVFMISETKIDNSFPKKQFHYEGYCVYRLDRTE